MSTLPPGAPRYGFNSGRHLYGNALGVVRYPNPIFDIAHTYLPTDLKSLYGYCEFYFLTNPLINAVVFKMAEYPITDTLVEEKDLPLKRKWEDFLLKTLNLKTLQIEVGLDVNCYGVAYMSMHYPFKKYLVCTECGTHTAVERQKYVFRNHEFRGECRQCGHSGAFKVKDVPIKDPKGIRVIRWNPSNITPRHNEATGETSYFYKLPTSMVNEISLGKRHIIERTPNIFLEAAKKKKAVVFNPTNLFIMKRPNISGKWKGGGLPMALPVLKDTFFLNVLRKSQEAVALERIVPMHVLFPSAATGTSDPYGTMNLTDWQDNMQRQIGQWRLDNNYVLTAPIPIGAQTIGGDGRAMLLSQEYRVQAEWIVAGMHVPVEFVFGGLQYSGSNVSLRQLEKHFAHVRSDHMALLNDFVIPRVAAFMEWPESRCKFRDFKLADDLQRNAFHLQLNQAGKLSDGTFLESCDFDADMEKERISAETSKSVELQRRQAIAQAGIQATAQALMSRAQMRLQQEVMGGAGVEQPGMAPGVEAMPEGFSLEGDQAADGGLGAEAPMAEEAPQAGDPMGQLVSPLNAGQQASPQQVADNRQLTGALSGPQLDLELVAERMAAWLDQKPQAERQAHLEALSRSNPSMYGMVMEKLRARQGAHVNSEALPMPEERTPRRGSEQRG